MEVPVVEIAVENEGKLEVVEVLAETLSEDVEDLMEEMGRILYFVLDPLHDLLVLLLVLVVSGAVVGKQQYVVLKLVSGQLVILHENRMDVDVFTGFLSWH